MLRIRYNGSIVASSVSLIPKPRYTDISQHIKPTAACHKVDYTTKRTTRALCPCALNEPTLCAPVPTSCPLSVSSAQIKHFISLFVVASIPWPVTPSMSPELDAYVAQMVETIKTAEAGTLSDLLTEFG